jgi:hypothetical protein
LRKKLSSVVPAMIAAIIAIGIVDGTLISGVTKLEIVIPKIHIATKFNEICLVGLSEFIHKY